MCRQLLSKGKKRTEEQIVSFATKYYDQEIRSIQIIQEISKVLPPIRRCVGIDRITCDIKLSPHHRLLPTLHTIIRQQPL